MNKNIVRFNIDEDMISKHVDKYHFHNKANGKPISGSGDDFLKQGMVDLLFIMKELQIIPNVVDKVHLLDYIKNTKLNIFLKTECGSFCFMIAPNKKTVDLHIFNRSLTLYYKNVRGCRLEKELLPYINNFETIYTALADKEGFTKCMGYFNDFVDETLHNDFKALEVIINKGLEQYSDTIIINYRIHNNVRAMVRTLGHTVTDIDCQDNKINCVIAFNVSGIL